MKKQRVFHSITGPNDDIVMIETDGWACHYNGIDLVIARDIRVDSFDNGSRKAEMSLGDWVVVEPITGKSITKTIQFSYKTRAAAIQALPEVFERYGYDSICEKILYFIAKRAAWEQEYGPIKTLRIGDYVLSGDAA